MQLVNFPKDKLNKCFEVLQSRASLSGNMQPVHYLDLGTACVKVVNYSSEFASHIKKQLDYILTDTASKNIDATLVCWKETNFSELFGIVDESLNPKTNLRFRVEMLVKQSRGQKGLFPASVRVFGDENTKKQPLIDINGKQQIITAFDKRSNTYYYSAANLEPEEFIKQGHIFVSVLNRILKTDTTALVHAAVVGLENFGVLFCARGQRGKSTLAVLAMLEGFDYVSDDYLVLNRDETGNLYSYPIYSIITLSPRMYNELYDKLSGARFVSNNSRKDKYVLNISAYHDQFRRKYPISVCMFPQITTDKFPSIVPTERGRAVTQLIHSTIRQMNDNYDIKTVRKLMNFVKDFEFYQINLCSDIQANVDVLREFCEKHSLLKAA